ncbi:hypothetical protein ROZALSC1DRAFT_31871 [Rozella allomycis CSF55]|uniref:Uncharacterized protein n=1 Tax=Rozella allomycis (strain CSF55) TaxID=988480 RepID=A0A4P9YCU0_ROZAC|nr:hypothetical protein ROZALSC1DRAFT_31871 [Rozella allomycis CSF55]
MPNLLIANKKIIRDIGNIFGILGCDVNKWHVNITFVGNAYMKMLNRTYAEKNRATDSLAFPYIQVHKFETLMHNPISEDPNQSILGDIYVSLPYIKAYCQRYGRDFNRVMVLSVNNLMKRVERKARKKLFEVIEITPKTVYRPQYIRYFGKTKIFKSL